MRQIDSDQAGLIVDKSGGYHMISNTCLGVLNLGTN